MLPFTPTNGLIICRSLLISVSSATAATTMVVATVALSAVAVCTVARGCHACANDLIEQVERALHAPGREMSDGRVASFKGKRIA